ncbi:MAG: response regulator transcription factor [Coprococcus sp.]
MDSDKRILIVEDHKDISIMLAGFLQEHGYETVCAYDGRRAAALLASEEYDIVLMDLMLPYKSGDELIKELRTHSDTPVICLSAKSAMDTRLEVLKMGADDYIIKPFDLNEVLVRIEVVLRRSRMTHEKEENQTKLSCGELVLFTDEHKVMYQDKEIQLTAKELKLLELFLAYPKKTYTKANLYENIWNDEYYCEDNTINVHISNLRNKLKKASGKDYIETVWGIGYRLKEE